MGSEVDDWTKRVVYPWVADHGDGTYRNPILCADYSDPDVIRRDDDFYLTASSFNCTPGLPILHSRDLVNWTIINHAVKTLPGERFAQVQAGAGVWAPSLRFHDGKFYLFFPMPDEGIFLVTADDPAGKWSEPMLVQAGKGLIDPCPLWDDDGKAYLVHAFAFSRAGVKNRLRVCEMAADGSRLMGEGKIVFEDSQHQPTLEGPKFHKFGDYYYILAPAGGVPTGWQLALRSKNVFGPYEAKVVLERGGTPINGPHQGALVDGADGRWWFAHFQELLPYGRILHLQPAVWKDGWPMMGVDRNGKGIGEPVAGFAKPVLGEAVAVPQTSDEFEGEQLGLQWQWYANHQPGWWNLRDRKGWLRLFAQHLPDRDLSRAGNLLLQKMPAQEFSVETRMDFHGLREGDRAGLVVMGREHAAVVMAGINGKQRVTMILNGREIPVADLPTGAVDLRVAAADGGMCTFSYRVGEGKFQVLPTTFKAREGVWIGAKVGIFCVTSEDAAAVSMADFDYFRFGSPV